MKWGVFIVVLTVGASLASGQVVDAPVPVDAGEPTEETNVVPGLPGVTVNREQGYVDLSAKVVGRRAEWLELVACSPRSREHESLVSVEARPSHVHLGLLLVGLEPGRPRHDVRREDGTITAVSATGGAVAVSFLLPGVEGELREVPASQLVLDRATDQPIADEPWVFAGSRFHRDERGQVYVADLNGTVVSLVSFGDDVLARRNDLTQTNDQQAFKPNLALLPSDGTPVTIRLRPRQAAPAPPEAVSDGAPAAESAASGGLEPVD